MLGVLTANNSLGWFPFLFYASTWVSEIYYRYDAPKDLKESNDALGDIGRVGSQALVVFSTIALVSSVALPWLITSPDDDQGNFTRRSPTGLAKTFQRIMKSRPDLNTAWTICHFTFAGAMILAPLAKSTSFATTLIALCGIPWVLAQWAPYNFLGIEINKVGSGAPQSYRRLSNDSIELSPVNDPEGSMLYLNPNPEYEPSASTGELAGIYLGVLNVFTTLPQFMATFISMVVFYIMEPGTSPELHDGGSVAPVSGTNAISVCLAIGAISSIGAGLACRRLRYVI